MKLIGIILLLFIINALCNESTFKQFILKYNKIYSPNEYQKRLKIFNENLVISADLNSKDPHAIYGITQFSDLTAEEFQNAYLMKNSFVPASSINMAPQPTVDINQLPDSYDWNDKGVVTKVYNQGSCGSCWAFSATEHIESMWAIAGNNLTSLSMQQIVDCDTLDGGSGGGWPHNAYKYVLQAGGMDALSSYPYTARDGHCAFKPTSVAAKITKWGYVIQNKDEEAMASWTYQNGPPSVCVDASSWQHYKSGVISTCGKAINHCVQVTGFQTMKGVPAWNVRNSWGTTWGVSGYLYVKRGGDVCSIATEVTTVTI